MTSTKIDQFCDPTHPQKLTIDLLFNNDGTRKYVTNVKTTLFHVHVDVKNLWSLRPRTFKTNHLSYLNVALRLQKRKTKNVQCLKISTDSADSFCTMN